MQPRTLASFETRCATLTLNEAGRVISLLQKASVKKGRARELLAAETPLVTVVVDGNRNVECHKMSNDNGILTATFPGLDGHARLRCESKGDYLKFTALEVTVPRVTSFVFFQCAPGVNRYRGDFAGLVSDDDSGIALRALDLQVNCSTAMSAITSADLGLTGYSAGLAAGPRSELRLAHVISSVPEPAPVLWPDLLNRLRLTRLVCQHNPVPLGCPNSHNIGLCQQRPSNNGNDDHEDGIADETGQNRIWIGCMTATSHRDKNGHIPFCVLDAGYDSLAH